MSGGSRWRGVAARVAVLAGAAVMAVGVREPANWPFMVLGGAVQLAGVITLARGRLVSLPEVILGAVLLRLVMLGAPPLLSDDVYRYMWDGLLQLEGLRPYTATPSELLELRGRHPDLFARLNSPEYYSVYPPVSQLAFLAAAVLAEHGVSHLLALKTVLVAVETGGVLLLARMVPAHRLVLYAWQPLVVLEMAGQVHTEALAVGLLVVLVWATRHGRPWLAGAVLAGAVWVKLYPLLLLPMLWWRSRWRGTAAFTATSVIVWLPYFDVDALPHLISSLALYVRHFEFNAGLYYALQQPILWATGFNASWQIGPLLQGVALTVIVLVYAQATRFRCSMADVWVWSFGAVLVFATTVHPWYAVPLLALLPLTSGDGWQWHAWSVGAMGTYLFYSNGIYWPFVVLSWGGWLVVGLALRGDVLLQHVQRLRARRKAHWLLQWMPRTADRILDLGAAEGYVGEEVAQASGGALVLADVVDMNRTEAPLVLYEGRSLPFEDDAFDVCILSYVLHHCADPDRVLAEAVRVTSGRVLVLESVYGDRWQLRLLRALDVLANRLRSHGQMRGQEEHLQFRRREEWKRAAVRAGADVVTVEARGRLIHRRVLYVLEPTEASTSSG